LSEFFLKWLPLLNESRRLEESLIRANSFLCWISGFLGQIWPGSGSSLMSEVPFVPLTRATLLLRIRNPKNGEAWRTFVELYTPLISRFCVRRGLQEADCRDVVQNVFATVHRQIGDFEYDPKQGLFRNWLTTIVLRQINRQQLLLEREPRALGGGWGDALADQMGTEEEAIWNADFHHRVCQLAMQRIRGEFSPEVFTAFETTWYYERKPAEVAGELGQSPAWVYQAKYRVLRRLKQEIAFLGAENFPHLPE
jgi:RNA polymerase sigma factor (sigma-70 family)